MRVMEANWMRFSFFRKLLASRGRRWYSGEVAEFEGLAVTHAQLALLTMGWRGIKG
jgi:hypothetical protein